MSKTHALTIASLLLVAMPCFAAPRPDPVNINMQSPMAPPLRAYQANAKTWRVNYYEGTNRADLSGGSVPFMTWAWSNKSSAFVTSSWAWVSAASGIVDFTFSAANMNTNGNAMYEVGVSDLPLTYKQGGLTMIASPTFCGTGVTYGTTLNWGQFAGYSATATSGPVRADGTSVLSTVNSDGSIMLTAVAPAASTAGLIGVSGLLDYGYTNRTVTNLLVGQTQFSMGTNSAAVNATNESLAAAKLLTNDLASTAYAKALTNDSVGQGQWTAGTNATQVNATNQALAAARLLTNGLESTAAAALRTNALRADVQIITNGLASTNFALLYGGHIPLKITVNSNNVNQYLMETLSSEYAASTSIVVAAPYDEPVTLMTAIYTNADFGPMSRGDITLLIGTSNFAAQGSISYSFYVDELYDGAFVAYSSILLSHTDAGLQWNRLTVNNRATYGNGLRLRVTVNDGEGVNTNAIVWGGGNGSGVIWIPPYTDIPLTNSQASIYYVDQATNAARAFTNGLASTVFAQAQTVGLASVAYTVAAGFTNATVTNGLASTAYAQAQTNSLMSIAYGQAAGFTNATVTNDLASMAYFTAQTAAMWTARDIIGTNVFVPMTNRVEQTNQLQTALLAILNTGRVTQAQRITDTNYFNTYIYNVSNQITAINGLSNNLLTTLYLSPNTNELGQYIMGPLESELAAATSLVVVAPQGGEKDVATFIYTNAEVGISARGHVVHTAGLSNFVNDSSGYWVTRFGVINGAVTTTVATVTNLHFVPGFITNRITADCAASKANGFSLRYSYYAATVPQTNMLAWGGTDRSGALFVPAYVAPATQGMASTSITNGFIRQADSAVLNHLVATSANYAAEVTYTSDLQFVSFGQAKSLAASYSAWYLGGTNWPNGTTTNYFVLKQTLAPTNWQVSITLTNNGYLFGWCIPTGSLSYLSEGLAQLSVRMAVDSVAGNAPQIAFEGYYFRDGARDEYADAVQVATLTTAASDYQLGIPIPWTTNFMANDTFLLRAKASAVTGTKNLTIYGGVSNGNSVLRLATVPNTVTYTNGLVAYAGLPPISNSWCFPDFAPTANCNGAIIRGPIIHGPFTIKNVYIQCDGAGNVGLTLWTNSLFKPNSSRVNIRSNLVCVGTGGTNYLAPHSGGAETQLGVEYTGFSANLTSDVVQVDWTEP